MQKESQNNEGEKIKIFVDSSLVDLIPKYIRDRKEEMNNISEYIRKSDYQSIIFISHKMKGNGSLFGMHWLSQKAALMERASENKNDSEVMELSKQILEYLIQVQPQPVQK